MNVLKQWIQDTKPSLVEMKIVCYKDYNEVRKVYKDIFDNIPVNSKILVRQNECINKTDTIINNYEVTIVQIWKHKILDANLFVVIDPM